MVWYGGLRRTGTGVFPGAGMRKLGVGVGVGEKGDWGWESLVCRDGNWVKRGSYGFVLNGMRCGVLIRRDREGGRERGS